MGGILRRGRFVLGALAVVGAAAALAEAAETTYRSPNHYSMRVPDGWRRVPDADLKRAMQVLASATGMKGVTFDAAFERADATETLAFPYILVQFHEGSTSGVYRDMERQIDQGISEAKSKSRDRLSDIMGEIGFDKPVVDHARHRVLITMRTERIDVGAMRGFIGMHLGAEGVAQVMLYSLEHDADPMQRTFAEISDSVRFEKGYEFGAFGLFRGWTGKALLGGIIGAVVGLLRGLLRKKKGSVPAPSAPYESARGQVDVPPWERTTPARPASPAPAPASAYASPRAQMDVPPWERDAASAQHATGMRHATGPRQATGRRPTATPGVPPDRSV